MGQQLQTQPAVHTGVPGIKTAPSLYAGTRGSLATPMQGPLGAPPPSPAIPQFSPGPAAAVPQPPQGAPGTMPAPVAPAPHPYALALRNSRM